MSKTMMKALLPIMAISAMMGGDNPYMDSGHASHKNSEPFVSRGMPVPRVKSADEIKAKKDRRKKFKARQKAKKGIYSKKIKYSRKRS